MIKELFLMAASLSTRDNCQPFYGKPFMSYRKIYNKP